MVRTGVGPSKPADADPRSTPLGAQTTALGEMSGPASRIDRSLVLPAVDAPNTEPPTHPVPRTSVWAEDASVVLGVAGAVLTFGTILAALWLAFWGVSVVHEPGAALLAGVDLVLVLLAVAFHHLALELARPLERTPELSGRHHPAR